LGELAGLFLGFKLTVAAFGYLQDIVFAGQPAVEAYKKYARDLRAAPSGALFPRDKPHQAHTEDLTLDYSSLLTRGLVAADEFARAAQELGGTPHDAGAVYAAILSMRRRQDRLGYADFTYNGDVSPDIAKLLEEARRELANRALAVPAKLRTGPSDYHSTEQSATDGPPELISLRLVALRHEQVIAGSYDDAFLLAQARGTWQAMEDAGRWVLMLILPDAGPDSLPQLRRFFERARGLLT
jgi:hypothetical protein